MHRLSVLCVLMCNVMHQVFLCFAQQRRRMEEMQAAAARPEVQQQMAQMAAVMQNKDLMERMQQLKVRVACQDPPLNIF